MIGAHYFGAKTGTFAFNDYTGKGAVDGHLDYAAEAEKGAVNSMCIDNTIPSNMLGGGPWPTARRRSAFLAIDLLRTRYDHYARRRTIP